MSFSSGHGDRTVHVHMMGGLGNQLFIFFTGLAHARLTSRKLLIDKTKGGRGKMYWETILEKSLHLDDVVIVPYRNFPSGFKTYSEGSFTFSPLPTLGECDHVFLKGYFQCFKYFESLQTEIPLLLSASALQNDNLHSVWTDTFGLKLEDKSRAVSVHIRRGDYLTMQNIHPIVSSAYYLQTTKSFEEETLFVIFSDDLDWCRSNYTKIIAPEHHDNVIFVPNDFGEIETFYFMSQYCERAHIIANSSFSWWIALTTWLRSKRSMKIVSPHPWFGPKGPPRYETIYNDGWEIRNGEGKICDYFGNLKN